VKEEVRAGHAELVHMEHRIQQTYLKFQMQQYFSNLNENVERGRGQVDRRVRSEEEQKTKMHYVRPLKEGRKSETILFHSPRQDQTLKRTQTIILIQIKYRYKANTQTHTNVIIANNRFPHISVISD